MIVKKVGTFSRCAICERTLLLGERTWRYLPAGSDWVDVCALCTDEANGQGWAREGSPTTPLVAEVRRRRRRLPHLGLLEGRRDESPQGAAAEPMLRRLSAPEQAIVEAAEQFDESPFRRTIAGIGKSLGEPRVSLLPLSGTNQEVVITIAWEISWYQYRVSLDSGQPIRLVDRGYELDELDARFKDWNASFDANGRLAPDIPRL
ncbi:MAG: hypothetical protein IT201_07725 [Thermoleophilia bacterium]|nr:hypothetical protein [Thermoleophilia bacterium]